ncbi:MAG: UDP-2,3-diacylglucosamine diphosphatase [Gammaproteobacteria bacterium]|nr:UDP-2,3-diacylglucosamine diphosphatase [Gammaproteobacteria bacterium]
MPALFISDLHLDPERPEVTELFTEFMTGEARQARALYILGDLFEAWIGDDDDNAFSRAITDTVRAVADTGVPVHFMHGNRDFLIGERFAETAGCSLLPEPSVIDLYGEPTLLMHGDSLCTDDVEYQRERAVVRDPAWQQAVLARPIEERRALARDVRARSKANKRRKPLEIMDVNPQTVQETMRAHGVVQLIHGHTHRPDVHVVDLEGRTARRIVLGDWHAVGSVCRCDAQGPRLEVLEPKRPVRARHR